MIYLFIGDMQSGLIKRRLIVDKIEEVVGDWKRRV